MKSVFLAIHLRIVGEDSISTGELFLLALLGIGIIILGKYMHEKVKSIALSTFGEVFVVRLGYGALLSAILMGIIRILD